MVSISRMRLVAFVLAVVLHAEGLRAQPDGAGEHIDLMVPARRASDLKPGSVVVQMMPDLALRGAKKKILPPRLGLLYEIERNEGNRLPDNPESHGNRALLYLSRGRYEKALFNLNEVIRLAPTSERAHRERAWSLSTCPEVRFRDGRQAVESGTRACELTSWRQPRSLITLAAACSQTEDFAAAIQCEERALSLLSENAPERAEIARVLARYRAKKPYHSSSPREKMGWKTLLPMHLSTERTPG